MNSGKIVAGRDGWTGRNIEGSTGGPRGPKNINLCLSTVEGSATTHCCKILSHFSPEFTAARIIVMQGTDGAKTLYSW